ncbi:MAG TPA: hypothetical protein VNM37_13480 [Candidatus Dormibacteraeota bacterium]|nr:hypothetical protein [Verrucomicrobiae bacterium]HXJ73865.1 hypothetical protein [Candidatus Dormibacteraeota bacterium]
MNARERTLLIAVGALVGALGAGFGLRALITKPLREIDQKIATARNKLQKIQNDRRAYFSAEDRLKAYALRTFADTVDQASGLSGEMLTRQILRSGLQESDFTRLPVGPRKLRGASEIGWSVQGDGPLADVLDLLFLLQESPHVSRLENLSLSTGEGPGLVKVRFRYLTLVLDPGPDVERKELPPKYTLESPQRHLYNGIVSRDLLRPYIKRLPVPAIPIPGQPSPGSSPGRPGTPPGPESFKIVSLSEWMGQPEVHVRDLTQQKTQRYRPGDPLAGGTVVCVDYRPLQAGPFLRSDSRVILKIGNEFWAIERGKTLADKRKLAAGELPEQLAKVK